MAVGHSLVYRLTGVVHFAFGELIALGVFVTLLVAAQDETYTAGWVAGRRDLLDDIMSLADNEPPRPGAAL